MMNCKECQNELEIYMNGGLVEGKMLLVKEHLEKCTGCSEMLAIMTLTDKVINEEKEAISNPFLSTRILSAIEELEGSRSKSLYETLFGKVLKPIIITATLTIALILGIAAGNFGSGIVQSQQIPDEIAYINDAEIESLDLFMTE